jgi:hypothetical protein
MRRLSRAFIVGFCVLCALPVAAHAVTFQAERGAKLRGSVVKRGGSVLLQGRATVSKTLSTPVLLRVQALARARPCNGWPQMRITLDGHTVARVSVRSRRWRSYGDIKTANKGRHKVVVRFLNPRKTKRCRRAIALDRVTLTARKTPPPLPPPPATGASALPPGTYLNPVYTGPAGGGFADPIVLDVGDTHDDYWAYATGGLFPVAHSDDLVHWTNAGAAMTSRPSWTDQAGEWNPWAPSVIERDDACPGQADGPCFVMFSVSVNRNVTPNTNCIGVAMAPSPGGPFTDTGILDRDTGAVDQSGRPIGCGDDGGYSNIDPAPFVDADGNAWLYLSTGHLCQTPAPSGECPWNRVVSVIPLSDDLLTATGPRQPLVANGEPWDHGVVENPWPLRNGDTLELLYSGGVYTGKYGMGYATADSTTGPFAKVAGNPFLKDSSQVLSAGGGSVATGPKGAPWVVYHGRAGAYNQPRTLRIDSLQRWTDGTLATPGPTSVPRTAP